MRCRSCALASILAACLALGMTVVAFARADEPAKDKPAPAQTPAKSEPAQKDEKKAETKPEEKPAPASSTDPAYVLDFTMKRIDGTDEKLETYKGKVVLIVNVASKCGLTRQYAALQKLYEDKRDAGLVILGFPANDFKSQEPGTNNEIKEFCESEYKVTFPMFEKVAVVGENACPLYKKLIAQPAPIGGDPKWNFNKFVVDRSGMVVARFEPQVKPDDKDLTKKIDELLAAKP